MLIAAIGFVGYGWLTLLENAQHELETQAKVLASNLGRATVLGDSEQARRTLEVLRAHPEIETAVLTCEKSGQLASYSRPGFQASGISGGSHPGPRLALRHLGVREPVSHDNEMVGTLYLQAEFNPIQRRFRQFAELVLMILLVCWLAAFWLATRLQGYVSKPVMDLLRAAQHVSENPGSTVRVPKQSEDELGQLVEGFNQMLSQIQARDAALRKARDDLELRVAERTRELQQEVAERRRVEEALADEKERLAVTLRSIGDGLVATDKEGRVTLYNAVAEVLTGVKAAEALGHPIGEVLKLVQAESRAPCEDPAGLVLRKATPVDLGDNTILVSRGGSEKHIQSIGAPIRDRDGVAVGAVFVFRDLTEKRRAAEELLKNSKLESIGLLAGGIAHDFNNILTAVMGNLSLARTYAPASGHLADALRQAETATMRISELTRQLLTFAKGGVPSKTAASLPEIVEETTAFALHGSKVVCRLELPKDLWSADVDVTQIRQVIQNISLNAVRAMPDGGTFVVRASNTDPDKAKQLGLNQTPHVCVSMQDTGEGIAPERVDRIFDPYFSTKTHGWGLGLAVAYSIVRRHGGTITVESTLGKGTTFHVYLPATDKRPSAPPQRADESLSGQGRVLVMDDEEAIRLLASVALKRLGYEVVTATDGAEAIEFYQKAMAENRPFSAVILDLTVRGGMGGTETIRRLRALDPKVRAIVSSGYSEDAVMANYREHGFVAAVAKPYRLQELGGTLQTVVKAG